MAKVSAEVGSTANRYQILGKLAVGGMAEIFLARGANATGLERYCVLKRILRERARDAQFVQMFLDEARLAAQLQHPNIASVYDLGVLGDSYFFTMEYVHGETVRSVLQRARSVDRKVPMACVLTILAGTAAGLSHAHDRVANDGRPLGIVHRDVSPSNLMVSFEGNVKILDFGVAKADDRPIETKSGTVKGKISYLSPEQCRGMRVDRRSDLFSLGIVMWEMLTGERLFRRNSDFENMTAIVHESPPRPSSRRSDVPRAVDDIVMRLLAKSVADRFQTATEVLEAIENASLRAGTILSTSAVSRLIRDLFGTRPEPWLALDAAAQASPRVTLDSRPLPQDIGRTPLDPAEFELAGVPDLSVSLLIDDDGDDDAPRSSQVETIDPMVGRGAPRAAGSIAPPIAPPNAPSNARPLPGVSPMPAAPPAPVAGAVSTRALLEAIANAVPPSPTPVTTLLGHSAPAVASAMSAIRQAALAQSPAATIRDLSPPTFAEPAGSTSAAPAQGAAWSQPRVTPSASFEALPRPVTSPPSAPHEFPTSAAPLHSGPVPTRLASPGPPTATATHAPPTRASTHRTRRPRPARFTAPLLAVMVIAAAIGALAAWFAMQ